MSPSLGSAAVPGPWQALRAQKGWMPLLQWVGVWLSASLQCCHIREQFGRGRWTRRKQRDHTQERKAGGAQWGLGARRGERYRAQKGMGPVTARRRDMRTQASGPGDLQNQRPEVSHPVSRCREKGPRPGDDRRAEDRRALRSGYVIPGATGPPRLTSTHSPIAFPPPTQPCCSLGTQHHSVDLADANRGSDILLGTVSCFIPFSFALSPP